MPHFLTKAETKALDPDEIEIILQRRSDGSPAHRSPHNLLNAAIALIEEVKQDRTMDNPMFDKLKAIL